MFSVMIEIERRKACNKTAETLESLWLQFIYP